MNETSDAPQPTEEQPAPDAIETPDRKAAAEGIVKNGVIAAMGVGLVPIPAVGIVGLVATNVTVIQSLSRLYGVPFKQEAARSVVMSLVSGLLPASLGVGFSELLKLIPGFGSLAGAAGTSILAGAVTYGVGRTFAQHFEEGGTFLSLDMAKMRETFNTEFKKGRKAVEELVARKKPAATPAAEAPPAEPPAA